jgi:hypothetical protein
VENIPSAYEYEYFHLHIDSESRGTSAAISIRDKFADFFDSNEGELPWQYSAI